MSVWGIGAYYNEDKASDFISNGVACLGWARKDAQPLHSMLSSIKIGDIIYIKSFVTQKKQLIVKAIGIVTSEACDKPNKTNLGCGVCVKWKENFREEVFDVTPEMYRNNVFNNSLYEEFNEDILYFIIKQLLN